MKQYNIPTTWLRDIATCGTYSHKAFRHNLWADWSNKQREDALSRYYKVLDKIEEFIQLKDTHTQMLGGSSSVRFGDFASYFSIDCAEHYWPKDMLILVEKAIEEENNSFEKELEELYEL